jgi:hypothetical protein
VGGGITTLTPQNITALDPLHAGPNPVMLNYFNSFFLPNDNSVGDSLNFSGYRFAAPIKNDSDVYIARFDYRMDQNGKHTLLARRVTGSVQSRPTLSARPNPRTHQG